MNLHTQAIVTVLSLMNPVVCGLMFQHIGAGRSRKQRLGGASKAALAMLVVLELAALGGAKVLNLFGISLDIFSVAGKGANGGGGGLVRSMLQGFMGLIVMAMGAQFGLTGLLASITTAP
jgi:small neutral amino acid transporter SnatA (MarC family)